MTVGEARKIVEAVRAMSLRGQSRRNKGLSIEQEIEIMSRGLGQKDDAEKLHPYIASSYERMMKRYRVSFDTDERRKK